MKLRYFFLGVLVAVIGIIATAGFRGHHFAQPPFEIFPDMNYQDKVKDQQPSAFFADGNSARAPIPGTVAMEMPAKNDYWATGKWDDSHWGNGIPVHEAVDGGRALAIDDENMARGRERYNISCSACHGAAGDGQGVVTKYGLTGVASYHNDRLRQASDGDIFNTISNGKGQMLGYGYNVAIDDRWRIVMYVRALQRSQNAPLSDATPDEQTALDKTRKPAPPPPAPPTPPPGPGEQAAPSPAPATAEPPATPTETPASTNQAPGVPNPPTNAKPSTNPAPAKLSKPPGTASLAPDGPRPMLLSQQTLNGWIDSNYPYPLAP
jgi:mono/diheme cytochrome c family protein